MASIVQTKTASGLTGGSSSVSFDAPVTEGNLIVVLVDTVGVGTPTAYPYGLTPDHSQNSGLSTTVARTFSKVATSGDGTATATIDYPTTTGTVDFTLLEVAPTSGKTWDATLGNRLDAAVGASDAGSTATLAAPSTGTLDDPDEVAVANCALNGTNGTSGSFDNGFTSTFGSRSVRGYKLLSDATALTVTATWGPSNRRAGIQVLTYKQAGAADPIPEGTATGAWAFVGAAVGEAPEEGVSEGTATGTWTFVGAAVGNAPGTTDPITETWGSASDGTSINGDLTWTEVVGDWSVSGNKVVGPASSLGAARAEVDLPSAEHYAEVDYTWTEGSNQSKRAGVAVRMSSSAATFYAFVVRAETATFTRQLYRVVGGSWTRLDPGIGGFSTVTSGRLRLEAVDTDTGVLLTCYVNGTQAYQYHDTSGSRITGNVRAGLAQHWTSGGDPVTTFDNFEAGSLAAPNAVRFAWQGAVSSTGGSVVAELDKTRGPYTVRLAYSTDPDLVSPSFTASQTPDQYARFDITGLSPATVYHWAVEVDGTLHDTARGTLRTFPTSGNLTIATASCAGGAGAEYVDPARPDTSNAPTFDRIGDHNPDLFIHMGDLHYRDIGGSDTQELYRNGYRDALANPRQAALYSTVPITYTWDDHDFAGNNSGASSPARSSALEVYRQAVPHYPVGLTGAENDTPIAQTFTIGRVRVILLDTRSERDLPTATILGTEQKQWLKDTLLAATEPLIIINTGVPWIADNGDDTWFGAAGERAELAEFFEDNDLTDRLLLIGGDMHGLAIDDGTNSQYDTGAATPGPPVLQCGPLDCQTSTKGGPYSEGAVDDSEQQYMLISVADPGGDTITVTATGYGLTGESESAVISDTFVYSAVTAAPEGAASGSWSFTGAAAGASSRTGSASGATAWVGAAVGVAPSLDDATGAAVGAWAFAGAAVGKRAPSGTASGAAAWVGVAAGATSRSGAATGAVTWVGTALGGEARDVTVLSITEHQRGVIVVEHQRVVTIEGATMYLSSDGREFYTLEIVTDPAVSGWEAHFGELDEADDKVWVAGEADGANTRWLLAGPDAELDAAAAVIDASVEPKVRAIDNPEIIVRSAPVVYLV